MDLLDNGPAVLKTGRPKRRTQLGLLTAILATASVALLASCTSMADSAGGISDPVGRAADGRQFASLRCAECHAMDREDFSPNSNAPPMKRLLSRLEFKMLERGGGQEVDMAHGAMPPLHLNSSDKEALVAYLKAIAD